MPRRMLLALAVVLTCASAAMAWRVEVAGERVDGGDAFEALAVFPNGDVVAVGSLVRAATLDDLLALRLQADTGRVLWRTEIDGTAGGDWNVAIDAAWDVVLMRDGDVVVGGAITNADSGPDAAVLRLDGRSGRERWRTTFRLPDSTRFDLMQRVLAHPSGDVIAIASLGGERTPDRRIAVRLDGRTGAERWRRELSVGGCSHDCGALDAAGNLLVAGNGNDSGSDQRVAFAAALDGEDGSLRWQTAQLALGLRTAAFGPDGVVLGGDEFDGTSRGVVVRLDATTGSTSWRGLVTGVYANVACVRFADDGAVLVGGTIEDDTGGAVFASRLEASTGVPLWQATLRRDVPDAPRGRYGVLAFTQDRRGTVIATLPPDPYGSDTEGTMLALDGATGTERWRNRTGADVMHALVRGGHGSVVGAGVTFRHEAAVDAIVVARDVRDGADVHRGRPRR